MGNNKKILIIEDEKPLSKVLKDNLVARGVGEVIQAYDGEEGLLKAKELRPDLILLDIIMPKMDGIQLLRAIRKNSLLSNTKVIVLTNLVTDSKLGELEELKIYDFIVKSNWDIEEVMGRVIPAIK